MGTTYLKSFGKLPAERLRVSPFNSSGFATDDVDNATMAKLKEIYNEDFELWEKHCGKTQ